MADRREFKKAVKVEIIKRAKKDCRPGSGVVGCEKCGLACVSFEIHHLREDALEIDKSKPLTAEDGALWCKSCHDEHTRTHSTPVVALVKRQEAKHLGAEDPNKQKIQQKAKAPRVSVKVDQIRALREAQFRGRM
jgi:Fe-S-cluster-containing dehydrogenase component